MGEDYLKTVKTERCQIFLLLKTRQHLNGHYFQIQNLSFHKNNEGKTFITVIEKNINIITTYIQTFTYITARFRMKASVGKTK